MRKFRSLDIARGLAALAVVFFHRGVFPGSPHPIDWIVRYGEVGAQIFFVISGYLIYQSAEKYFGLGLAGSLAFLRQRIRRIYPAFWTSLLIAFLVAVLIQNQSFSLGDVLGSATLTYSLFDLKSPQVVYWTLVHEQQFYIIIAILILPYFQKIRTWLVISSSLIVALYYSRVISNWYMNATIISHWLEFEIGIVAYFIVRYKERRNIFISVFCLLFLIGLLGNYRSQAAVIFACLIFPMRKFDSRITEAKGMNLFNGLGILSYSLYLIHIPIFTINDYLISGLINKTSFSFYLSGILMSIIFAIILFVLVEKPILTSKRKLALEQTGYATQNSESIILDKR